MFATKRQGILKETKSLQNPRKDGVISKQIMQLAAIELTIFPPWFVLCFPICGVLLIQSLLHSLCLGCQGQKVVLALLQATSLDLECSKRAWAPHIYHVAESAIYHKTYRRCRAHKRGGRCLFQTRTPFIRWQYVCLIHILYFDRPFRPFPFSSESY